VHYFISEINVEVVDVYHLVVFFVPIKSSHTKECMFKRRGGGVYHWVVLLHSFVALLSSPINQYNAISLFYKQKVIIETII
jgi:hypothetical protein